MYDKEVFASSIRALRAAKKWTQAELSSKSGVEVKSISNYETADTCPSLENAAKLATAFGVTVDYMLEGI